MKFNHFILAVFILFLTLNQANAQLLLGLETSNYGGVYSAAYNPASIADSRYKVQVNLVSTSIMAGNTYIYMDRSFLLGKNRYSKLPESVKDTIDIWKTYFGQIDNERENRVYAIAQVTGPSAVFTFGKKNQNGIGLFTKLNTIVNADRISPEFSKLAVEGFDYQPYWNLDIYEQYLNVNAMSWTEYGLAYSRVVLDRQKHFFKVGGTLKIIQGVASGYFHSNNAQINFPNDTLLSVTNTDVSYGHSDNFNQDVISDGFKFVSLPSAAGDIGVIYEYRPNKDNYLNPQDCQTGVYRKEKDKYLIRVGFAVTNIGAIKFTKGSLSQDFYADKQNINLKETGIDGVEGFDNWIDSNFAIKNAPTTYNVWLPTTFNVDVDYNIGKGFYVNAAGSISSWTKNQPSSVHYPNIVSLTPRYDHKWFGAYLPLSYDFTAENLALGLNLRLGPLIVGTNDLTLLLGKKKIKTANVNFGLNIPIPHQLKRDKDKDGLSNKFDACKKTPGPCETKGCPDTDKDGVTDDADKCPNVPGLPELNGCPDMDGDGITDAEDDCPDVPGIAAFKGCPDTDGDGIQDLDDKCPELKGLKEFDGCPDTDADGIIDPEDACPTEKGLPEFKGCPVRDTDGDGIRDEEDQCPTQAGPKENKGCPYSDMDGDGVIDEEDQCPKTPGLKTNHGCPEVKEEVKQSIQKAFDNLEFETGKSIIRSSSYPSLNDLSQILSENSDYNLLIEGHTDNVGNRSTNMTLSKNRAEAVKKYLVNKGVPQEKLTTKYYGPDKPIADNSTPEGRQRNRRVEMKIIFE